MATTLGSNQVPGGTCPDHWHCVYPDRVDHGCGDLAVYPEVHSACPSCGAIMMPGGAVTPSFFSGYQTRLLLKQCLRSIGGVFVCNKPASPVALLNGACLCARHNR
jgi:hypothetical protein